MTPNSNNRGNLILLIRIYKSNIASNMSKVVKITKTQIPPSTL